MPALQNLVLTDRATTPVNHTLVPRDIIGGVATVVETNGVAIGEPTYSISNRRTAGKVKSRAVLTVPIVQTEVINGISAPKIVRKAIVDATFTFDLGSTEQERKDAVGMFMSSLDPTKVLVNDTIVKQQGLYGS